MVKKNVHEKSMSNLPLLSDDLVQLDNRANKKEPQELIELNEHVRLYITSMKTGKLQIKEERISPNSLMLKLGSDYVVGQIGKDKQGNNVMGTTKETKRETKPFLPKWSGVDYHPKLTGSLIAHRYRTKKGKRRVPEYVFPPDDRTVYVPSGYPWRCIGLIRAWSDPSTPGPQWIGTGALVGKNIVITASHVCPWTNVGSWMMQFIPAYYDGTSLLGNGVYSYVQIFRGYRDHGQGDDMATLRLYTPLGNSIGWFGSKTYNDDWEGGNYWTKCGYPGMVAGGNRPSRVTSFPITDDDNDGAGVELEYFADSSGGDSGGPVFGWWDNGPHVIGTHSGWEDNWGEPKQNVAAGGSALPNLIIWAQNNW